MAQKSSNHKLKIRELFVELKSTDLARVKKGLSGLKVHGDASVIKPLLEVIQNTDDKDIAHEIWAFIDDLSDSSAKSTMIETLLDENFKEFQIRLLNSMWNSKLNYSEHTNIIVELAVKGSFEIAFECLTIIENLDGPFEEAVILDAKLHLTKYDKSNSKDAKKDYLISEIAILIQDFDRNAD